MGLHEELAERTAQDRVAGLGRDLDGGQQRERPLMQPGMGNDEVRLSDALVAKQQDVEIQRSIRPALARPSPEPPLDALAGRQQRTRREPRAEVDGGVEEDLSGSPQRHRAPDPADREHLDLRQRAEGLDRQGEDPLPVSQGAAKTHDR